MQSRWRSKTAWTSLFALILFVLKSYTDYEIKNADELITLVMLVLGAWGFFNNPKDKDSY